MQCSSGKARAKEIREKEREKASLILGKVSQKEKVSPILKEKGLERIKVQISSVVCHYCGKQGHMKKECFKFQRDQIYGQKGWWQRKVWQCC